jgi:hypothetical protein
VGVTSESIKAEPVKIEVVRACHFKAKGCKTCGRAKSAHKPFDDCDGFQRQNGCANCGKPKNDLGHYGQPPSYNAVGGGRGTGSAAMVGAQMKQAWQRIFADLLAASGFPRPQERIFVEGEAVFPDRGRRDQGNFRVVIEKALGDALHEGGWLEDDDWDRYEFGNLVKRYQPGVSATRLYLFPMQKASDLDQMELIA